MFKNLLSISLVCLTVFNCSIAKKTDENNASNLLALLVAANTNPGCSISTTAAIKSNLTQVESKPRTKYSISACDDAGFNGLGLTQNGVTKGATGQSSSSVLYTTNDVMLTTNKGGTNIEVSFIMNSASSTIDVIAYGTGSPLSGPTYRLIAGAQTQYKNASDVFSNTGKGGSVSAPIPTTGTTHTFCLDFQYTMGGSRFLNGFNKPCSELTDTERGSMSYYPIMQMMNVPAYTGGNRLGFVLNGVTITSFTVGSIVSNTEM
ncbi:hypothetical protein ND861_04475 [Leptospira sp. 2 VSF19]|uniref:Lipoprotein n=1 Tax=Leptospira soteropolitanensis TaxID=2950025 RepID=A0AAW5VLL7_9LEPT|nr:hypothetical protein [Leptospira soteropolitanensis]MCW7491905.1 hypothetical protein [Leptospira soteropolitanensis]MCW7499489.1 hypothetical protein [Leptospira soteropolitanensis]MCW7520920.1 hypothetical protein [Leptospira soteropolitanensis]MCW7525593.1 hypothetical protein [Leptospira soteropolitanensis]MCW7529459.1 hypothetical protein [Leptospira soteropolitanensis]